MKAFWRTTSLLEIDTKLPLYYIPNILKDTCILDLQSLKKDEIIFGTALIIGIAQLLMSWGLDYYPLPTLEVVIMLLLE